MIHNLAYPPHVQHPAIRSDGPAQAPPAQHDADVGASIVTRREPDVDQALHKFQFCGAVFVEGRRAVF